MSALRYVWNNLERLIMVALLAVLSVVVVLQVVMRYVVQASLSWSEEMARYVFVWLVYLGISYAVKAHAHVKVEAATMYLPRKIRVAVFCIADLLFLFYAVFIAIEGNAMAAKILRLNQTSPSMSIPMGYIYMALPVGFGLTALRLLESLARRTVMLFRGEEVNA